MIASLLLNAFLAYAETVKLSLNSNGQYNGKNVTAKYESTNEYTAFVVPEGEGEDFIFDNGSIYIAGSDGKKTDYILGNWDKTVIFGETYTYAARQIDDDHMGLPFSAMYVCEGKVNFDPMGYSNNDTRAISAFDAETIIPSNCEYVTIKFIKSD